MFSFLSSDWFTLGLEIVFLLFIAYDLKKYFETKKREYIVNIVLAFVFFLWAVVPFYNAYITWQESDKAEMLSTCKQESNQSLCECIDDKIFKEYSFDDFISVDKNATDYKEFIDKAKEECQDDSWF